jgi:hypothetical protein
MANLGGFEKLYPIYPDHPKHSIYNDIVHTVWNFEAEQ